MKKIMMSLVVGLLVVGSAFGKEATMLKDIWISQTSNGVVQVSSNVLASYYGTQQNLDICIANNWDASLIANALKGKQFTHHMAVNVNQYLTASERITFVPTVASGVGKETAIRIVQGISKSVAPDGTFDALFAMPDVVISQTDVAIYSYLAALNQTAKKAVTFGDLTPKDFANWLLLGGTLKSASNVSVAKEQIKKLTNPLAKRSLRSKGKSFVSTTSTNEAGVVTVINPIEQEMKPIVDALNAPKLAGLEAALTGIGVDASGIVRDEAVWEPIIADKDAIFYGDKKAHPEQDGGIILLLGPEGYNLWVKQYNEGSK
jgi:hypothetical protein